MLNYKSTIWLTDRTLYHLNLHILLILVSVISCCQETLPLLQTGKLEFHSLLLNLKEKRAIIIFKDIYMENYFHLFSEIILFLYNFFWLFLMIPFSPIIHNQSPLLVHYKNCKMEKVLRTMHSVGYTGWATDIFLDFNSFPFLTSIKPGPHNTTAP